MNTQDIINCWETGVEPYNATKGVSEYPETVSDNESNETRGEISDKDRKRMRCMARDISLQCRRAILYEAQGLDVPTIKYKQQYLLEEVIADMESFV